MEEESQFLYKSKDKKHDIDQKDTQDEQGSNDDVTVSFLKKDDRNEVEESKKSAKVSYKILFRYATTLDWCLMIIGTITGLLSGCSVPILFVLFGDLTTKFANFGLFQKCVICAIMVGFDEETIKDFEQSSIDVCGYFVIVGLLVFFSCAMFVICWSLVSVRQVTQIRQNYFKSILSQDISFHDLREAGRLNSCLKENMKKIGDGMGDKIGITIQNFSVFIGCLVVAFIYTWKITLVNLAIAPFLGIVFSCVLKVHGSYSETELNAYSKAGAIAEQAFLAIRTITAFSCQEKEVERYSKHLCDARKVGIKKGWLGGLSIGFQRLLVFGMYGVSFWYGSKLVIAYEINVGDFITAFFSVIFASFALGTISKNLEFFSAATTAASEVFEIIDTESKIDVFDELGSKPDLKSPSIEIKGLSFNYPSRPEVQVLSEVNLRVGQGEKVAIVGQSGGGKSSIIQLLQRFYDPKDGEILFNGHDIKTLNVRHLRQHIGVVSQEPVLFNQSIGENIKWGGVDVTYEEMVDAAKLANAYNFIMELPEKFDTLVGDRGMQISGGQKQRIAIARAVVKKPSVLLLDEATSALDRNSEQLVQNAIDNASKGLTTVVIAHRLSTIRNADQIIVLDKGKVLEQGNHDELITIENGVYRNLINLQNVDEGEFIEDKMKIYEDVTVPESAKEAPSQPKPTFLSKLLSNKKEGNNQDSGKGVVWRIFQMNKPEWGYLVVGVFFSVIAGSADPILGYMFGSALSLFAEESENVQSRLATESSVMMFLLGCVTFVAYVVKEVMFGKSGSELTVRIRKSAFHSVLRQDISFFDEPGNSSSSLAHRLSSDAVKVQGCTGARLSLIFQNFGALGSAVIISFLLSWQLSLLMLALFPFLLLGGIVDMWLISGQDKVVKEQYRDSFEISSQGIDNIRLVTSSTKEEFLWKEYKASLLQTESTLNKKNIIKGIAYGYSQLAPNLVLAAVFRLAVHLLLHEGLQFEYVFSVFLAMFFGAVCAGENSMFIPDYAEAKSSALRILSLMDTVPSIDVYSEDGKQPAHCSGVIDFKSVHFTYPNRAEVEVLKNCELRVEKGETLALVGHSGCGKSTCVKLIERFYDVTEGQLLMDGVDVKELNVKWLRLQLGFVSQEPVLFDRTIRENIVFGDCEREISEKEIIGAAKLANIHQFIDSLPQKYETRIGSQGSQLSGGQKQRISIARALIRNPKVMLLDEATSALDSQNEKSVQDALDNAMKNRTCIVIAHRLSTLGNCDKIAVIEDGKIVEMGSQQSLIQQKGSYYKLVNGEA